MTTIEEMAVSPKTRVIVPIATLVTIVIAASAGVLSWAAIDKRLALIETSLKQISATSGDRYTSRDARKDWSSQGIINETVSARINDLKERTRNLERELREHSVHPKTIRP